MGDEEAVMCEQREKNVDEVRNFFEALDKEIRRQATLPPDSGVP